MLVNGLDMNNDSPIHLAAYRKQKDIFLMLAAFGAFLDQPNAGGQDPIQALQDPEIVMQVARFNNLSAGSRLRIEKELAKINGTNSSDIKDSALIVSKPPADNSPKKEAVSSIIHADSKPRTLGHQVFDHVMKNQANFINSGFQSKEVADRDRSRSPTMLDPQLVRSRSQNKSDASLQFELLAPNPEYYDNEEIVITNIVPPSGFFYPLKSTAFDMLPN